MYLSVILFMKEFTEPPLKNFLSTKNESDNTTKRWDAWYSVLFSASII